MYLYLSKRNVRPSLVNLYFHAATTVHVTLSHHEYKRVTSSMSYTI